MISTQPFIQPDDPIYNGFVLQFIFSVWQIVSMGCQFCVLNSVSKLKFCEFHLFSVKTKNQKQKVFLVPTVAKAVNFFLNFSQLNAKD